MRNIKLTVQYDGTAYSGWQVQRNGRTVQGEIEKALKKLFGTRVRLNGAGRTDAGVHAAAQVATFTTRSLLKTENIRKALNSSLPRDIVIRSVEEVPAAFDAQFSAKAKTYRYTAVEGDALDPLMRYYAALVPPRLDLGRMRQAARLIEGRRDWRAFQKAGSSARTTVRTVKRLGITKRGAVITFEVEADGFLYNMVRNIVGTLIEVGRGRIEPAQVGKILAGRDRRHAGPTAPAKGLCLMRITY